MAKQDPKEIYRSIREQARSMEKPSPPPKQPKPVQIEEPATKPIPLVDKKQFLYDKELHEAIEMAVEFERSKTKDGYVFKEGIDVHGMAHSLVILCNALRGEILRGETQVVTRKQLEIPPDQLDTGE